jgi:hypothetical protein
MIVIQLATTAAHQFALYKVAMKVANATDGLPLGLTILAARSAAIVSFEENNYVMMGTLLILMAVLLHAKYKRVLLVVYVMAGCYLALTKRAQLLVVIN